jgi:hypothetical protein
MQKTISSLVQERLKMLNKTASEHEIKKAYHRNYQHRRGSGQYPRQMVADQISHYLILNNLI